MKHRVFRKSKPEIRHVVTQLFDQMVTATDEVIKDLLQQSIQRWQSRMWESEEQ